ncbi:hypothetical protein LXL04_037668 [Taraxacum kok-saghyz]
MEPAAGSTGSGQGEKKPQLRVRDPAEKVDLLRMNSRNAQCNGGEALEWWDSVEQLLPEVTRRDMMSDTFDRKVRERYHSVGAHAPVNVMTNHHPRLGLFLYRADVDNSWTRSFAIATASFQPTNDGDFSPNIYGKGHQIYNSRTREYIMYDLCEKFIVEIFTRLPPKSLLRFRSLSKSLCKKKYFCTLHGEDELSLCVSPNSGYISIRTKVSLFPCRSTHSRTVGSCDGISVMRIKTCLSLWNPSIKRKLSVPVCPQACELPLGGIGFGFDPITDDYKIVWISCAKDSSFVYAIKMGTWCEIASLNLSFLMCYWRPFYSVECCIGKSTYILTFDLSTHVFGMIPLPGPICNWLTTSITTIQGSLALVACNIKDDDTWIWVWRDASWCVVFKLGTGQLPINGVLQLQPQANNDSDLLLSTYGEGLQIYNSKTRVRSRVGDFCATASLLKWMPCVETLQLLDMRETASETTL